VKGKKMSKDQFLTARSSQSWKALGINFYVAGIGSWILFTLPTTAAYNGIYGLIAYVVACVVPLIVLIFIGPAIRKKCPNGVTITEFIKERYGRLCHACVGIMVVFYMSISYISELTALGSTMTATYGLNSIIPICITALVTTIYTAYGGLPTSMLTDKIQGWSIILLIVIVTISIFSYVDIDSNAVESSGLLQPTRIAIESFYVLTVAITGANLFHQGYWQRIYSSKSDKDLIIGLLVAGVIILITFFILGFSGIIAIWGNLCCSNEAEYNNVFFSLTLPQKGWINVVVLILVVSLVCSCTDTLQIGLTATIVNDVFDNKIHVNYARLCVIILTIPIVILASKNADIMRLFLIADLYSTIVAVIVVIAFFDRFKKYKTIPDSQNLAEGRDIKENLNIVVDEKTVDIVDFKEDGDKKEIEKLDRKEKSSEIKGEPRKFYINGYDCVIGIVVGIISIAIFGWIFHKDFKKGLALLLLPDGMSIEGESLGAFLAAPLGTLFGIFVSAGIRTLYNEIVNKN
jgi:Na+/proline symporter